MRIHGYIPLALLALLGAALLGALWPCAAYAQDDLLKGTNLKELPWTLRDHYKFTYDKTVLMYGVENAEWRIESTEGAVLADKIGFRVTFADGTSWTARDLEKAAGERETVENDIGTSTRYWSEFPIKDGLVVRHTFTQPRERPFMIIELTLRNEGENTFNIAKIEPVIIGPESLTNLAADAAVTLRPVTFRGLTPVPQSEGPSGCVWIRDKAADLTLILGTFPEGLASGGLELASFGGAWQGGATSIYTPPVVLGPKGTVKSEPVWMCCGLSDAEKASINYAWSISKQKRPETTKPVPLWWVTVEDGDSLDELSGALGRWQGVAGKAALIPFGWEGRPGSLNGGAPAYPKDMGSAARELRSLGASPGITVDPLMTDEGAPEWSATSADGRKWLNLANPAAREAAVARMAKVTGWGFDFLVIRPSDIPDEVLAHFQLSRSRADTLAFEVAGQAAAGRPVLPTSLASPAAKVEPWLEIAAATSRMDHYLVPIGPVRVDFEHFGEIDEDAERAMRLFPGPIELLGHPKTSQCRALANMLNSRTGAMPCDPTARVPKQWSASDSDSQEGGEKDALSFP